MPEARIAVLGAGPKEVHVALHVSLSCALRHLNHLSVHIARLR